MNRTASKLVTGRHYSEGEPRPITGYLTQCPSLNGLALSRRSADALMGRV